jgi:hypothetical protein
MAATVLYKIDAAKRAKMFILKIPFVRREGKY